MSKKAIFFQGVFFFILGCLNIGLLFLAIGEYLSLTSGYIQQERVEIIFCDVGQGDAALIQHRHLQILVDSGQNKALLLECLRHMPLGDQTIELVMVTHPDFDHMGAMEAVLERFNVLQLMTNTDAKKSDDFSHFQAAVLRKKEQGMRVLHPMQGQRYQLGDKLELSILSPQERLPLQNPFRAEVTETMLSDIVEEHEAVIKNYNDRSIAAILKINQVRIFLTGDIEAQTEQALHTQELLKKVDILKVAHHGSKTSTTSSFAELTAPEISIISAGKNNRYGHPDQAILSRLEQVGSKILRTDVEGELRIETDGKTYWMGE